MKNPVGQVVPVHQLQGRTRRTRSSAAPEVARAILFFQLVPTLGPSTCVQTPFGIRTPQLDSTFLLEQQLHEQFLVLANLLFLCRSPGGEPSRIPLRKPICIHSLSACTFPVLAIIYLKTLPIFMQLRNTAHRKTNTGSAPYILKVYLRETRCLVCSPPHRK